jgi:serine protease Do
VLGDLPDEEQLASKNGKTYSRGGLALSELTADQRRELNIDHGLLVEEVTGDAARAGIQVGDVITSIDGRKVTSSSQVREIISAHKPGDRITVTVERGNATKTLHATLGSRS